MHDTDRILRMEKALNDASAAVQKLSEAAGAYAAVQEDLSRLEAYLGSEEWLADLQADEEGLLPRDLRRGVLSQDAVYDLLCDNDALKALLRELLSALDNEKTAPDEV